MSFTVVPVTTKRLTKGFYLKLTAGLYLVSVDCIRADEPAFEGIVVVDQMREAQWNEIKKAGVDYKNCRVFRSRAHFDRVRALMGSKEIAALMDDMTFSIPGNN